MGNVAGCHMLTGRHTMPFLIIKEHICTKGLKKGALIQPPQEQGFINPDIPVTQRAYDSLMGWRGTRRHQSRTDGAIFLLELRLQVLEQLVVVVLRLLELDHRRRLAVDEARQLVVAAVAREGVAAY